MKKTPAYCVVAIIFHELGYVQRFLASQKNRYFIGLSLYPYVVLSYSILSASMSRHRAYNLFDIATFNLVNRIKYMS
jgi:hypothetical protein